MWKYVELSGFSLSLDSVTFADPKNDVKWVVINDPWPPYEEGGSRYFVPFEVFESGPFESWWYQWQIKPAEVK